MDHGLAGPLPRNPAKSLDGARLVRPLPGGHVWLIRAVRVGVVAARNLLVEKLVSGVGADGLKLGNALDDIHRKTEAIDLVLDSQLHGSIDIAVLLVSADVYVLVIRPAVSEAMDEPRISMEIEDDGLIDREEGIEIRVRQAMRMVRTGLQLEEIHDIDIADLEVGKLLPQEHNRRKSFLSRYVTSGGHDNIGLAALVVAGPIPRADSLRAVSDSRVHVHVLQVRLFIADDDVHVVLAA